MVGSKAARQGRPPHTFGKPSHAWREGWLLIDGWPTQEGVADSAEHDYRSHDIRQPAATLDGGEAGASWSHPLGAAAARYPSWWPVAPEPTPAPPAPPPAPAAPRGVCGGVENLAVHNGAVHNIPPKVKERVDQTARAFNTPAPAPRAEAKPAAVPPVPISWRFSDPEAPATTATTTATAPATATPADAGVIAQQMQQMQQWMAMQQAMMQQMQQLQQLQQQARM